MVQTIATLVPLAPLPTGPGPVPSGQIRSRMRSIFPKVALVLLAGTFVLGLAAGPVGASLASVPNSPFAEGSAGEGRQADLQAQGKSPGTEQGKDQSQVTSPLPAASIADPAAQSCGPNWVNVSSPSVGTNDNALRAVAVASADNVWAVGYYGDSTSRTLIQRWQGPASGWSIVPSPNQGTSSNLLYAVAVAGLNDVWAVGTNMDALDNYRTLILRWSGSAWAIVPSPNQGTHWNALHAVTVAGPNDVWAVGYYSDGTHDRTLILRWNGSAWAIVPSPNQGTGGNYLDAVATVSASDVWAVGYYTEGATVRTLIEHWNGAAWSIVPSPNQGASDNILQGIAAGGPNDVWAVGHYRSDTHLRTLIEHWNGVSWTISPSPNPFPYGTATNSLVDVAVAGPGDVWAIGRATVGGTSQALVEHFDGTIWSLVSAAPMPGSSVEPVALAVSSSSDVWAVGRYVGGGHHPRTLTEHWNGSTWSLVASPNLDTPQETRLVSVDAATPGDVWAAGRYFDGPTGRTLIEHFEGNAWSLAISPNAGADDNELDGISAVSASDVWAVGTYDNNVNYQTLIEHWNGTAWSIVSSPNQGTGNNSLEGVAALSANDVWAVGYYGGTYRTLIEHWNGTAWSIVSSPNQGASTNRLLGVAVVSPNNVWAVGYYYNGTANQTLILHWNGTSWSIQPSPNVGTGANTLGAITATSASDAWAVGWYHLGTVDKTLTMHWNGASWTVINSPNLGTSSNYLLGVAEASSADVWAVGQYGAYPDFQTLIEHWNGTSWSTVSSPSSGVNNELVGVTVAASNPDDIWAVGSASTSLNPPWALIERYNPCPPATPTPTPTRTPPQQATPTATASPTSCAIQYPDVPPGSTFYDYIRCLACRGIVSGYGSGTFGPGNPVTRGQLSKIVSNSANYQETFTTNTFQDVAVGSTFFLYIERLYAHGVIGGYPCGGPGEECIPPDNKPYFRPGANVTRGQTSKIVAIARGLQPPPPGQWTFQDVPVDSTFWTWIEALVATGAIGGYACGGPGEECVPPGNRPYFRPGANVTRGQSTKIVANTFFPNCSTPAK